MPGPSSRCPPRGLSQKHIMARTFAAPPLTCPWRRIQVCQTPCTPSEATPLTKGVYMGQEQCLLARYFWLGFEVHVFGFVFFLHPAISGRGVARCASCGRFARTPPPPGGAASGEGLCQGRRGRGLSPPDCLFFAVFLAAGGGLCVWFSALSCCGSVVVAIACLCLGPLGLRPPLPPSFGLLFFFFLLYRCLCGRWPATSPLGVCAGVSGVSFPPALRRLFGRGGPLFRAGHLPAGLGGPPVAYWRAPWVPPLVLPGRGVACLCAVAARLCGCATVPPVFLLFCWPAGVCSLMGGASPVVCIFLGGCVKLRAQPCQNPCLLLISPLHPHLPCCVPFQV